MAPFVSHRYTQYHLVYFFAALIVLVIVSPLAGRTGVGNYVIQVLFTLMIGATVFTTSNNRKNLIIALFLAIPWLLLSWSGLADLSRPAGVLSGIFLILLNGFVFALILSRVSNATTVNANIISGALGLYLLIGITWAVSYVVIELVAPGSFSSGDNQPAWSEYLYFSLTTLTTLGYGDMVPKTPFAQIWSTLEAVTGVLYLAVLIARLVSLYRR